MGRRDLTGEPEPVAPDDYQTTPSDRPIESTEVPGYVPTRPHTADSKQRRHVTDSKRTTSDNRRE